MDRRQIILNGLDTGSPGLEIGPSYNPVAPKAEGHRVEIIDHLDINGLRTKYQGHDVDVARIEEVDYVWTGQKFCDLTGKKNYYDWIIASHVIEHTTDLVGFLNNCEEVLTENGVLSLAIPDKRYCFDFYRPLSGLADVIDTHLQLATRHSAGRAVEHLLYTVKKDNQIVWTNQAGDFQLIHGLDQARDYMRRIIEDGEYIDVHAWKFVPYSFRLIMVDLYSLNLTKFVEIEFHPTVGCEFYIKLRKSNIEPKIDRLAYMREMAAQWSVGLR